ncbi:MAG: hypothetical protein U1F11_08065 [Steroidobacteraceae bacterium]
MHHDTGLERERLLALAEVRERASAAKAAGATRFCMGAAWRSPKAKDIAIVSDAVREVRALGMESCATLGMLSEEQARELKDAGLDYYNHNIDTSPEYYGEIITTRGFDDRLRTLGVVPRASTSAAAASSAWARARGTGYMLQVLANCRSIRRACRCATSSWPCRRRRSPGFAPIDPFDFGERSRWRAC